jgi:hypothetical protein
MTCRGTSTGWWDGKQGQAQPTLGPRWLSLSIVGDQSGDVEHDDLGPVLFSKRIKVSTESTLSCSHVLFSKRIKVHMFYFQKE